MASKPSYKGPDSEKVQSIFSSVAPKYDKANQVLSFGVHHLWRKTLVKWSEAKPGQKVLDCATGTGDLALEFKKAVGPQGVVLGTDFSKEMLALAPAKASTQNLEVSFEWADVTQLSYPDAQFDVSSISFGIRNVQDPLKGLTEMARVTKPGGFVMVLEFGQVKLPLFSQVYNFYSQKVLPKIGGLVTGDRKAYEYLQSSSAQFPCGKAFEALLLSTGKFSEVSSRTLTGGIAYLYKARVI